MSAPVLMIATVDVEDRGEIKEYQRQALSTLQAHGARILAADDSTQVLEGGWSGTRTAVVEFPSAEAIHAWYSSPEYQAAAEHRKRAGTTEMAFVRALPTR